MKKILSIVMWVLLATNVLGQPFGSNTVTIMWNQNSDTVSGYKFYYRSFPSTNYAVIDVGNTNLVSLQVPVNTLFSGKATAYLISTNSNTNGTTTITNVESDFSSEIRWQDFYVNSNGIPTAVNLQDFNPTNFQSAVVRTPLKYGSLQGSLPNVTYTPLSTAILKTNDAILGRNGGTLRTNYGGLVGMSFIAKQDIALLQLGRWTLVTDTNRSTFRILYVYGPNTNFLTYAFFTPIINSPVDAFQFGSLIMPLTLTNGVRYFLYSYETLAADPWYDRDQTITENSDLIDHPIASFGFGEIDPLGGKAFGPVTFRGVVVTSKGAPIVSKDEIAFAYPELYQGTNVIGNFEFVPAPLLPPSNAGVK